jgi:hypothetical protein
MLEEVAQRRDGRLRVGLGLQGGQVLGGWRAKSPIDSDGAGGEADVMSSP